MEDWKKRLEDLFKREQQRKEEQKEKKREDNAAMEARKRESISFVSDKVVPAFNVLKTELEKHDMNVSIEQGDASALMTIRSGQLTQMLSGERQEFQYAIYVSYGPACATPIVACSSMDRHNITRNNQTLNIADISKDDIINDFMGAYQKHRVAR